MKKIRRNIVLALLILFVIIYWFSLPSALFKTPCSTVLYGKDGTLLGALISDDGQWRFPYNADVPEKFKKAIVQFEDRSFYYHPGVNLLSMGRSAIQNINAKKVVSGGSTLTMQVIRMSRHKGRTFLEKLIESILATRLELSYSKNEILALYASNAPFGSNVVGLNAAAWRYFGRNAADLTWAETATLAVLPNAPSLIYPGKNQELLLEKRNRLLDRLKQQNIIDAETCALSKQESLPNKPYALPSFASHLLIRSSKEGFKGRSIKSTVDVRLQQRVSEIVEKYHKILKGNEIHNAAALVLDVETGGVLAYVGNTTQQNKADHGNDVDVIVAPRSTGSILKPFLYAAMLSDGELLPNTLVPDIPTVISGYAPQNFNMTYDGAVPAKRALSRSLNVPAVKMLQQYGIERFSYVLKKLGMSTINKPAGHYGLSIILGGAEGTLWDIAGIYAGMARTLGHYSKYGANYSAADYHKPYYLADSISKTTSAILESSSIFDAASIKFTFDAMVEVNRPDADMAWKLFSSSTQIAWKTGTSFGFRDGWAIGLTPDNVVAVWVGNANGEGRPGLTGIGTAAPIMFEIFGLLKTDKWFEQAFDETEKVTVCKQSGHRATQLCEPVEIMRIPKSGLKTAPCPYHKLIHLDATEKYRVNSECEDVNKMIHRKWFILPPSQEIYYKSKNPTYKELPPYRKDCVGANVNSMDLIYPNQLSKIYVPVEFDGTVGKTVFEVAHRRKNATVYWHLDDMYMGSTTSFHQMGLTPKQGQHLLTLVDDEGETISRRFEIVAKEK
jgi:penicillin-binding protein 1C